MIEAVAWQCVDGNRRRTWKLGHQKWKPVHELIGEFGDQFEHYATECYVNYGRRQRHPSTKWYTPAEYAYKSLKNGVKGVIMGALATHAGGGPKKDVAVYGQLDACPQCEGLIVVKGDTWHKRLEWDVLLHYTKFIKPGMPIVDVKNSRLEDNGKGVLAIATVRENGERVITMLNRWKKDLYVVMWPEAELEIVWNGRLRKNSVTTWVLPKPKKQVKIPGRKSIHYTNEEQKQDWRAWDRGRNHINPLVYM